MRTSRYNGKRAHVSVTCDDCGEPVVGALFVGGLYSYRCDDCVPPSVRARTSVACEGCGRMIVELARDQRLRHVVCSRLCQCEVRNSVRRVEHEPRTCAAPGCGETFTPSRADAVTCSGRCRTRRWRAA